MIADLPQIQVLGGGQYGIWAVPYKAKQPLKPFTIAAGTLVSTVTDFEDVPNSLPTKLDLTPEGLTGLWKGLVGLFRLPSGEVAAIYGGLAASIGTAYPDP
jgi:hypothetical protein